MGSSLWRLATTSVRFNQKGIESCRLQPGNFERQSTACGSPVHKLLWNWPGILLALGTLGLVFPCHHLTANRNGGQMHQRIEELGSILVFAGRPLPNHACTKLVFIQYRTNDAWGIYLQEIATGKRKMLDVLSTDTRREGVVYEQLRTFGWSPDDQHFAYSRGRQKRIVICDVESRV